MVRKKGESRRQITSTLREDLFLWLQEESLRTGIPMSKILDRAVEGYSVINMEHKFHPPTF